MPTAYQCLFPRCLFLSLMLAFVFQGLYPSNSWGFSIDHQPQALKPPRLDKGISLVTEDEQFKMNLRFRMQNQLAYESQGDIDLSAANIQGQIRRLRLRLGGHAFGPRLRYNLQLSFSRGDQDFDNSNIPNVVRDALITYELDENWEIAFGQSKLPGNRQRVVSSGELQFVDRSVVNRNFNVDRDIGIWLSRSGEVYEMPYVWRSTISSGEGRGVEPRNGGIAYTSRFEILPFGEFKDSGDYFESDLLFEKDFKLSLGLGYSFNDQATRTGGKIGVETAQGRSLGTSFADLLIKHQGLSLYLEFMKRDVGEPIVRNIRGTSTVAFAAGQGFLAQLGYMLTPQWEVALRHGHVEPNDSVSQLLSRQEETSLALNRFIVGHRVKLQSDLTYVVDSNLPGISRKANWVARLQFELGI